MTTTTPMPQTVEAFMAQAVAMELDAAQRYAELADTMETHNNLEVAELFRKMAVIEGKHADQIMAEMGWSELPTHARAPAWEGHESAESVPVEATHYLMRPWHALQLALAAEQRAERFFARLVAEASDESIKRAARELQLEEQEHVALIQQWLTRVPQPEAHWDDDPDPPRYNE